MKKIGIPAAIALIAGLASCYNDKSSELYPAPATCDTANVTYSGTIKPMVNQKCATPSCHEGSAPGAGYDMTTYTGLKAAVQANRLLGAIHQETGYSAMPKNMGKLDDCSIVKFEKWVAAGAPNN